MSSDLRGLFVLLVLGAGSTILALRIWGDLQRPPEIPAAFESGAAASDQVIEVPTMPKYDPPPIERFAAVFDRPLFSPDRRPSAEASVAADTGESRVLSATLRGILFSNQEGVALLSPIGETTVIRVSQGDIYLGWRLLEIDPDRAVFEMDGETITLELIYKAQSDPLPPPKKQRQ